MLRPEAEQVMAEIRRAAGRPMVHDLRAMVDAVGYVARNGIEWRALPVDFPPWEAVYAFFQRWSQRGLPQRLTDRLRGRLRTALGRDRQPSAAIVDSESVKGADTVGAATRGFDGGKKINGSYLELKSICPSRARRESKVRRIASWMGLPSAIHHGSGRFDARAACGHAGFRARVLDAVG